MIDIGGAILSFADYVMELPRLTGPKPVHTVPEVVSKIAYYLVLAWLVQFILVGVFNLANHPLVDFPGPRSAAFAEWYKTYRELFCGESWVHVLEELHKKYGTFPFSNALPPADSRKGALFESVQTRYVRAVFNPGRLYCVTCFGDLEVKGILTCSQLSFSDPAAYYEIYNGSNRWDKEDALYQSFGQDHAMFGYLKYADAMKRRDVMSPLFSRQAVTEYQGLIQSNVGPPIKA
jgi:hypothetical protein